MKHLTRRTFLQNLGVGSSAFALALPSFANNLEHYEGKKLNIALCGLGRYAGYLAESFAESKYCHLAGLGPMREPPAKKTAEQPQNN